MWEELVELLIAIFLLLLYLVAVLANDAWNKKRRIKLSFLQYEINNERIKKKIFSAKRMR
jgi:hypothetical protein